MATPPDSNNKPTTKNERNLAQPTSIRPAAPAVKPPELPQTAAPSRSPKTENLAGASKAAVAAKTTAKPTPPPLPKQAAAQVTGSATANSSNTAPKSPAPTTPAARADHSAPARRKPAPDQSAEGRKYRDRPSRPLTRPERSRSENIDERRPTRRMGPPTGSSDRRPPPANAPRRPAPQGEHRPAGSGGRRPKRPPAAHFRGEPRPRRRMAPPLGAKPNGRFTNRPRRGAAAPILGAAPATGSSWGPLLFGVLLLAGVSWLAIDHYSPQIQQDLLNRSEARLDDAGLGETTQVSIDGRNVTLNGLVGNQQDSERAEEIVAATVGVRAVNNQLSIGTPSNTVQTSRTEPSLAITNNGNGVVLSGVVSDQKFADKIKNMATAQFGEDQVSSEITIDEAVTNPGWAIAVNDLLPDMSNVEQGTLAVEGGTLVLSGVAADVKARDALGAKAESLLAGQLSIDNQIEAPEPVARRLPAFASVTQTADEIVLNGFMSEDAASQVAAAYENNGMSVVNNISTNELAETPAWLANFNNAIDTMSPVTDGKITVARSGNLKLQGSVETDEQKQSVGSAVTELFGPDTVISNEIAVVPAPIVPTMSPFASITQADDKIMISGLLPKDAAKELIKNYRATGATIADNITIDERVMQPQWTAALGQSLAKLENIERGGVSTTSSGTVIVRGVAESEAARDFAATEVSELFGNSVSLRNDISIKTPTIVEPPKPDVRALLAQIDLTGVRFKSGSAELDGESVEILQQVISVLNEHTSTTIEIGGHTDSLGNPDYNFSLSADRADAVQRYMINQGIGADRLSARGYGPNQPIATNDTAEGRALNRRIEIQLTGE